MAPSKSPAPPHHCYSPKMGLSKHEKVVCWKFETICKPSSTLKSGKGKEKHFFSSKQPVVVPPQDRSSRRTHCSCQPCRATSRAEEWRASTSSYLSLSLQKVVTRLPLLLLAINETFLSVSFEGKARRRLAQGGRKYYLEEVHWKTGRLAQSTIWKRCRRTDRQKTLPVIVASTFEKYRHPQLSTEGSPAEFFWRTLKFETTFSESRSKQVAEYFVARILILPGKAIGCSRKKTNHFQNDSLLKKGILVYGVFKILLLSPAIIRGKY